MKRSLLLGAAIAAMLDIPEVRTHVVLKAPEGPRPADNLSTPFRDNEKIRAAAEKRARRAKRGW